jgi:hypothetical protein
MKAKLIALCALPAATALLAACSGGAVTVRTETSIFLPSSVADIAQSSTLRVEGRVVSAAEVYQIPPDPAGSPDPNTGERADAAPQVFAFEVARIVVLKVLGGRGAASVAPGDTVAVGVTVLDPGYSGNDQEDQGDVPKPGETFGGQTGQTGVFFLTDVRPLGSFGQGRGVMGFARYESPGSTRVLAVFGALRGKQVSRSEVAQAAASTKAPPS